jgi:AAA domain
MRIDLSTPDAGIKQAPYRILLYGDEGVGKSTFAAGAPGALFLDPSRGTAELDVKRVPLPEGADGFIWQDVVDVVDWLLREEHQWQTLVLDELGEIESMAWDFICERDQESNIEGYGYGKGYEIVLREWRLLLSKIERLQREKGTHVVFLGHSLVKTFQNPEGDDFDRHIVKVHHKLAGLLKQWTSAVFFARYEELVDVDKKKRARGVSTGRRMVHTVRKAAYDAKNRYDLPEELELPKEGGWETFTQVVEAGALAAVQAAPQLLEQLADLKPRLSDDFATKVDEGIAKAAGDVTKLTTLLEWAQGKITETKAA